MSNSTIRMQYPIIDAEQKSVGCPRPVRCTSAIYLDQNGCIRLGFLHFKVAFPSHELDARAGGAETALAFFMSNSVDGCTRPTLVYLESRATSFILQDARMGCIDPLTPIIPSDLGRLAYIGIWKLSIYVNVCTSANSLTCLRMSAQSLECGLDQFKYRMTSFVLPYLPTSTFSTVGTPPKFIHNKKLICTGQSQ